MSDTFRELEQAHEAKFKLDQELGFKAQCRRNKLLGRWAAEKLGFSGDRADAYARELVSLALDRPGLEHVVIRLEADLAAAGVAADRPEIIAKAGQFYADAVRSLAKEFPSALGADHVQVGG